MDYLMYYAVILFSFICILFLYERKKRREKEELQNLFGVLVCKVKCEKCGYSAEKTWERGDYMMKYTTIKHFSTQLKHRKTENIKGTLTIQLERQLCKGKVIIDAIYVIPPPMNKEELKYKQLCDKWR